jgi:phosphoglycerate dehydrogenase-like enzyme
MNRRHFLAASTSAASLAAAPPALTHQSGRLKVIVPPLDPADLADLKAVAPTLELVVCQNEADGIEQASGAAASYALITPAILRAGKGLKWVQQPSAGVEGLLEIPELVESSIVLTNMQRAYGPEIADQAIGYLLCFTRSLTHFVRTQSKEEWRSNGPGVVLDELAGKTLLVIALGGIGSEIARRAAAFGMRVLATDPKVLERPPFVEELHRPDAFSSLLPRADVVASAVPLTRETRKMIGAPQFATM